MTNQRVALVTGASSGFGELTALRLAKQGYRVFGTSRREQPARADKVEMLVLDVRSDESVHACIEKLLALTNRIDLLINNAGQAQAGVIEETTLEQATNIFEANFWGVVRVTGAVLPRMRQQRSGQIINISSLAGLIGTFGQGFYSASKFALEGYSEALRIEVEQFNIKVSLIEPGFFKTELSLHIAPGTKVVADYQAVHAAVETSIEQGMLHGGNPEEVAEMIVRVAQSRAPRLRYRVGSDSLWVPRLKALLPERWFQLGMRRRFSLPRRAPEKIPAPPLLPPDALRG